MERQLRLGELFTPVDGVANLVTMLALEVTPFYMWRLTVETCREALCDGEMVS